MKSMESAIERCIVASAASRDRRGQWRPERALAAGLIEAGASPAIAAVTARAAIEVGACISARAKQWEARKMT